MTGSSAPRPSSDLAVAASAPALDVFALRDSVVDEYERFATSFTTIHAQDIREQVEAIYAEKRYWPEPLIQINPSYKRSTDVGALVANGTLDPGCADIFRADGRPLSLYEHQKQAIAIASAGESFVVTTGTGSGKSLCFFVPIVSHVLAARRSSAEPRTHAIVVYPMNALANSQMEFDRLVNDLLRAGATHGLVSEENTPFDQTGWRLNDACVVFKLGDDPTDDSGSRRNEFFRDLYENLAGMLRAPTHPLFGFEAREHTAQVDPDNPQVP